jgi:drug/metabolite transporter superfamily protein YnfA
MAWYLFKHRDSFTFLPLLATFKDENRSGSMYAAHFSDVFFAVLFTSLALTIFVDANTVASKLSFSCY